MSSPLWMGPNQLEGNAAFKRARAAGLSLTRSMVLGHIGSFRDCWAPRRTIAARVGCSIRTVQRAITQGKSLGLIGVARLKKTETPPGAKGPLVCGGSHRWTVGYGKTGEAVERLVEAARLKYIARAAVRVTAAKRCETREAQREQTQRPRRRWTAEELDAELERIERERADRDARARDGPT